MPVKMKSLEQKLIGSVVNSLLCNKAYFHHSAWKISKGLSRRSRYDILWPMPSPIVKSTDKSKPRLLEGQLALLSVEIEKQISTLKIRE